MITVDWVIVSLGLTLFELFALLFLVGLHLFLGDSLHHVHHHDTDSDHQHHWALEVNQGIEWFFKLEVPYPVGGFQLQRVVQTLLLRTRVQRVQIGRVLRSQRPLLLLLVTQDFDQDWLKVKLGVVDLKLVEAWQVDVDLELAEDVHKRSLFEPVLAHQRQLQVRVEDARDVLVCRGNAVN